MKTAISLPNELFGEAQRLAGQLGISRSELYGRALREFLARHTPDQITQDLDALCDVLAEEPGDFLVRAGRRVVERTEW